MEKCVILYQGYLCIYGGRLGRLSLTLYAGFLFLCQWEGGFWFDFVDFDFTARARGGAHTELPSLAEGATTPRPESAPGFSEDSMATQSY